MPRVRHKMRVQLAPQPIEPRWRFRAVTRDDAPVIGQFVYDAYRGTIDDQGETPEDALVYVQGVIGGVYGPFLPACSFLIEQSGEMMSAVLITEWEGAPLVADVVTAPQARNQGMASFLLRQAMSALVAHGYTELYLFVTEGNAPAQRVYAALGFEVVS